jgi:hypothetical protein
MSCHSTHFACDRQLELIRKLSQEEKELKRGLWEAEGVIGKFLDYARRYPSTYAGDQEAVRDAQKWLQGKRWSSLAEDAESRIRELQAELASVRKVITPQLHGTAAKSGLEEHPEQE